VADALEAGGPAPKDASKVRVDEPRPEPAPRVATGDDDEGIDDENVEREVSRRRAP
jgi:hypothetical protein